MSEHYSSEPGMGPLTQDSLVTSVLMGIIALVGLVGNMLMLRACCKYEKLRTNFYTVFCGLSIADMAFLLTAVPVYIRGVVFSGEVDEDNDLVKDTFADKVYCKSFLYLTDACGFVAAYLLVVLAVLRAILLTNRNTRGQPRPFHLVMLCLVIYVISFVSSIPIINTVSSLGRKCIPKYQFVPEEMRKNVWLKSLFSLFLPLSLVITVHFIAHMLGKRYFSDSYSPREKEKSRLVIAIIVAFAICQFPYRIVSLYSAYFVSIDDWSTWEMVDTLEKYMFCLLTVDKAVRPILYSKLASDLCVAFDEVINCTYCSRAYYQEPLNDHLGASLVIPEEAPEVQDTDPPDAASASQSFLVEKAEVYSYDGGPVDSTAEPGPMGLTNDESSDSSLSRTIAVENLGRSCDRLISTSSSASATSCTSQTPLVHQQEEVEMLPERV
ncbi:C-c chemokine receptor type 6 [Plakobranchus ocellatus]|uniref:C-c chemokine receptor type 6 n=1 Tax=Plakobranchus ocellatus TaxID=259542 RepID=A0AAV4B3N1_9GAST|nr:C-c chemokine receptor type 6 [Plakobranchus ocellatus]